MSRGPVEVAAGDAVAADVEFTRDADGNRLHSGVEDVDLGVGGGPADRDRPNFVGIAEMNTTPDGRLGGAVLIEEFGPGEPGPKSIGEVAGQESPRRSAVVGLCKRGASSRIRLGSRRTQSRWEAWYRCTRSAIAAGSACVPGREDEVPAWLRVQKIPATELSKANEERSEEAADRLPVVLEARQGGVDQVPMRGPVPPWACRWSPRYRSRRPGCRGARRRLAGGRGMRRLAGTRANRARGRVA